FLILSVLLLAAVFGPALAPYGVNAVEVADRLQPPSADHWFGTDELGRDVFSRVVVAARVSLQVGVIAVGISLVTGVVLGLLAGYYGGVVDDVIMRFSDMLFAFPAIL